MIFINRPACMANENEIMPLSTGDIFTNKDMHKDFLSAAILLDRYSNEIFVNENSLNVNLPVIFQWLGNNEGLQVFYQHRNFIYPLLLITLGDCPLKDDIIDKFIYRIISLKKSIKSAAEINNKIMQEAREKNKKHPSKKEEKVKFLEIDNETRIVN